MKIKKINYMLFIALFIFFTKNITVYGVDGGVAGSSANISVSGSGASCYRDDHCKNSVIGSEYQGIRLQLFSAKKEKNNKWKYTAVSKPVDIYHKKTSVGNVNTYAQTRFAYSLGLKQTAITVEKPKKWENVNFLTKTLVDKETDAIANWVKKYFIKDSSSCISNMGSVFNSKKDSAISKNADDTIKNICKSVFSTDSSSYYFVDVEPLLILYDKGKGTLFDFMQGTGCQNMGNQCGYDSFLHYYSPYWSNRTNNMYQYMPALAYVEESDVNEYTPFLTGKGKYLNFANWSSDYTFHGGGMQYIIPADITKKMYGILILSFRGSTSTKKTCSKWESENGLSCGSGYQKKAKYKNISTKGADFQKNCCEAKPVTTCKSLKDTTVNKVKLSCPKGTTSKNDSTSATANNYFSTCCTATCSTVKSSSVKSCSLIGMEDKSGTDNKSLTVKSSDNSKNFSDFAKQCCKASTCTYTRTSDFPNNSAGSDCCKFFSQDNYKNLPSGITVDKFKEDYPQCFTGTTVTYSANDPSCGVMHTTYNILPNVSFNTDTWIYLLKNSIGNTTTTFDSYNSSNKTVKMNTVCDSDEVKNNSNVSCSSTYDDDSTCNFVCYQKLIITLPGKPNGSLQIGQHFVWPNNSTNSKFLNAPLFAQTIRICRAMTNKVLDDAGKSACQVYFSNNNGYQASNTNITLNYDNAPYTGTETSLVAYSENNSEYESKTEADYGVQYSNASNGNSKTAKEYTFSKMTYYSLPENYFAYSPKSKLLLPTSSATDMTKYTSIGYGNLPISWTWKKDDEKQVTLNLSSSSSLGGKSIGLTYTCKFSVDDFGGPPNGNPNSCPLYSQKPGETPTGFEQCLKSNSYASCVSKYCYNDTVSLYCPQDCQDGKNRDCRVSEATTRLRTCMQSSDYETCVKKECPLNSAVVYRTISLASPFPGKNGIGRSIGTNWNNDVLVKTYITDTQEYYNKTPMYEITLGPNEISKIRTYNNTNGASGYLNDTLTCEKGKGIECRSDFIKQFKNLFQSNTCGMSIDWDECDSR